ncbi:hypothetical protein M885DRAFT_553410 [Pelagophyceae sp. CCMP2097]|nr:hypothetical protein M885DRAFT_553410 [Pelagophyceae sp. CCMP2097]
MILDDPTITDLRFVVTSLRADVNLLQTAHAALAVRHAEGHRHFTTVTDTAAEAHSLLQLSISDTAFKLATVSNLVDSIEGRLPTEERAFAAVSHIGMFFRHEKEQRKQNGQSESDIMTVEADRLGQIFLASVTRERIKVFKDPSEVAATFGAFRATVKSQSQRNDKEGRAESVIVLDFVNLAAFEAFRSKFVQIDFDHGKWPEFVAKYKRPGCFRFMGAVPVASTPIEDFGIWLKSEPT